MWYVTILQQSRALFQSYDETMNTRIWMVVCILLFLVIIVLGVMLVVAPAPATSIGEPFASEMVKISSPLPNASVPRIFTVKGYARGTWFFEASFPVKVNDASGTVVGSGIAQADGEWMTEDFVPFTALVTVADYSGPATLVLLKDNPSGLPENDDAVSIQIVIQ